MHACMKKVVPGILFVLLSASMFVAAFNVQPAKANTSLQAEPAQTVDVDWWPMFHHDLTHTGYSTSTAPNTNQILWNYTTGGSLASSPAVAGGVVYVGSKDGKVYAFGSSSGPPIPESPSYLVLPLFMMATLLAALLFKRNIKRARAERQGFIQQIHLFLLERGELAHGESADRTQLP